MHKNVNKNGWLIGVIDKSGHLHGQLSSTVSLVRKNIFFENYKLFSLSFVN